MISLSDERKAYDYFKKSNFEDRGLIAKEVIRQIFLNDFYEFAKYGLGFKDVNWRTHGELITALETKAQRRTFVMPRGTLKSSTVSIAYPHWRVLKDGNIRILIDSELYGLSATLLRAIKSNMKSDFMMYLFGDIEGQKWHEAEIIVSTRTNPSLKESTIEVGGVDTTKVGKHYDLIIGDDYNSRKNSDTIDKCLKVIDHYKYNLNILEPTGEYILVGTRYSEMDVIGYVLRETLNEKHLAEGELKLTQKETKPNGIKEQ